MTVHVHASDHERARQLMLQHRAEGLPPEQYAWLDSHLSDCSGCATQYAVFEGALRDVQRGISNVTATRALVRATQLRVRERAAELRHEQERMSPLWIATALAAIWAVISAPFLWYGFEWVGSRSELPALIWQTLFAFAWLMPTGLIAAVTLWTKGARALRD
jgi:hypothetical protein